MAVYSICFKPWLSVRVFLQGYLASSVHDEVFPNCRENKVNGNYTRTKNLKLQYKVAAKVPSKSDSAIYPAGIFFLHFFFARFFFQSPSLA